MTFEVGIPDIKANSETDIIKSREQIRLEIIARLAEFGVVNCPDEIINRLIIIEENSDFNHDSEMICEAFENVLVELERENPQSTHLTSKQKEEGLLAVFLHDIGKTGPASAGLDCRLSIIKLFSVKDLNTNKHIYVKDVITDFFPEISEKMLDDLKEVGVGEETTMRAFWNNQAWWTHNILRQYPDYISNRVDLIASSHHMTDGENPCGVLENDVPYESKLIGALEHYVDYLEERMLTIIDKYQAALIRPKGGGTHESAMLFLNNAFETQKRDEATKSIISIIDKLGRINSLFPNTKNRYQKNTAK
jgi:hypothetical protein